MKLTKKMLKAAGFIEYRNENGFFEHNATGATLRFKNQKIKITLNELIKSVYNDGLADGIKVMHDTIRDASSIKPDLSKAHGARWIKN